MQNSCQKEEMREKIKIVTKNRSSKYTVLVETFIRGMENQ